MSSEGSSPGPGPGPGPGGSGGDGGGGFTLPPVLSAFAGNPRRFILGAVLTTILDGLFNIGTVIIDGLLLGLGGSQPFGFSETEATWGLADVPFLAANALTGAGSTIGTDIVQALLGLNEPLFSAAETAGPLAPVLVVTVVVVETGLVLFVGSRIVRIAIDVVPGGGGLI